jgi:ferrous-iron efflux pump FieF
LSETNHKQSKHHAWLLAASYLSVVVAITLIAVKGVAWVYTGSASLLASLIDSLMDSLASIINMFAIRLSIKPADEDHRFGHGKAEALAAVAQAAFIFGSSVFLFLYCIERFFEPGSHSVQHDEVGIGVMIFSTALTAVLIVVQRIAIKKTGSTALAADSLHYASDMAVNLSIIIALVVAMYGFDSVDLYLGFGIALYIAYGAYHVGAEALDMLMDKALPEDVVTNILAIALQNKKVEGVHELRTRQSGMSYIIQMHLEMRDDMPLRDAHVIADTVELGIRKAYPNADVIIHQDPVGIVEHGQSHFADRVTKDDLNVSPADVSPADVSPADVSPADVSPAADAFVPDPLESRK